jgi:hypothetical protein
MLKRKLYENEERGCQPISPYIVGKLIEHAPKLKNKLGSGHRLCRNYLLVCNRKLIKENKVLHNNIKSLEYQYNNTNNKLNKKRRELRYNKIKSMRQQQLSLQSLAEQGMVLIPSPSPSLSFASHHYTHVHN